MAFTTSGQETEWAYSYSPGAHTAPGYILSLTVWVLTSANLTQLAQKAAVLCEIAPNE